MKDCPNEAIALVPWAGKNLVCCTDHMNMFVNLSSVMGSPCQPNRVEGLGMCKMNGEDIDEINKHKNKPTTKENT